MSYTLIKNFRDDYNKRESFFNLAFDTFEINLKEWYLEGYWTDGYIPYGFFDGDKLISNISVNTVNFMWDGKVKNYIQLGTVMTDKDYRNQGLSRQIMTEIIAEYESKCDCMYLFANDSVTSFYPKFGYKVYEQFEHVLLLSSEKITKLSSVPFSLANYKHKELLYTLTEKPQSFCKFPLLGSTALLAFYSLGPYKDNFFVVPDANAIIIGEADGDSFYIMAVYGGEEYALEELVYAVCPNTTKIKLGFTPNESINSTLILREEPDETLFILDGSENLFIDNQMTFPVLSHS